MNETALAFKYFSATIDQDMFSIHSFVFSNMKGKTIHKYMKLRNIMACYIA